MVPAFRIRMSRRSHSEVNFAAALRIEAKEARSRGICLISTGVESCR